MPIWGRRDSEPSAEQAHESQEQAQAQQAQAQRTQAQQTQAPDRPDHKAEPEQQTEEPPPAFWRAQGEAPAPSGRDPADDAPPPAHGYVPGGGAPDGGVPGGTGAPAPIPAGAVIDGETAVKDPALARAQQPAGNQGRAARNAPAGRPPATAVPELTVAVAREPAVGARESPPGGAQASSPDETSGFPPGGAQASSPGETSGFPPGGTPASSPGGAQRPPATGAEQPGVAATITPQRWSEILVAFVDDPRGSVTMATDAVDEAIDEFVNLVRARQRDLASTWQGAETGTEQLRTALLGYRKLWHQVRQLDLGGKTGL